MILEAFLYATARTNRDGRRLGLVGDAVALWSRATRCRRAWAPHQARCEAAVRRAIAPLPRGGAALVLGSGLTREIALPALAARFDRVILVDAVHLLPVRWRARRFGAECVVADLTASADPLAPFRDMPLRFVLSANCLSQLPMAATRCAEASSRRPGDLARQIVDRHLDGLLSLGVPACLLTDTRYRRVGRSGSVIEEIDLLAGRTLPPSNESWDWDVAPPGEIERHTSTSHRVHAFDDVARSMAG